MNFLRLTRLPGAFQHATRTILLFLFLALILAPVKPVALAPPTASATAPPNIVVIMADDLDVRSLQQMLQWGLMPNLQNHIISGGSTFTNAFVTNSLCCPSRATFLTGQYGHNHGVLTNVPPTAITALDDSSTIGTWMNGAGYRTGYIGKYLNQYGLADHNRDGIFNLSDVRYVPPGWNDWRALVGNTVYRMYGYMLNENGRLVSYGTDPSQYQTDVIATRAAAFIRDSVRRDASVPFFLVVMPTAPHVEVELSDLGNDGEHWRRTIRPAPRHTGLVTQPLAGLPSFNEADVRDKPSWLQARPLMTAQNVADNERKMVDRMGSLMAVDDLVGTIFTVLRQTGTLDNTVVVFTSDNGYQLGEHRLSEKAYSYEAAIRVALYVRAPGFTPGQIVNQVVLNNDLAPTIADFAGVTPGRIMDGTSFRALMANPAHSPWRQRFLIEHWRGSDFPLDPPTYFGIRTAPTERVTPNQLWVEYSDAEFSREFYDLNRDPYQLISLHRSQVPLRQQQMTSHRSWLSALRSCRGRGCQLLEFAESRQ
jgi:N-acetylglucosamine-6-sulfatase